LKCSLPLPPSRTFSPRSLHKTQLDSEKSKHKTNYDDKKNKAVVKVFMSLSLIGGSQNIADESHFLRSRHQEKIQSNHPSLREMKMKSEVVSSSSEG